MISAKMKDRLSIRATNNFFDVLVDLQEGLGENRIPCAWVSKAVRETDSPHEKKKEFVEQWMNEMQKPLVKGSAKYRTAVSSILGGPATVYHALKYRDAASMEEASSFFKEMQTARCACIGFVFWEYMDEMTEHAFTAARSTAPRVPGSDEIANDISKRKREKQKEEAVLGQGAYDTFCELYRSRDLTPPDIECFQKSIKTLIDKGVTSSACKARECEEGILGTFKELKPLNDDDWDAFTKMFALCTMETAIPGNMMKGIEEVASQLVNDITSGKASMDSLNVEDIGNRVLSGVSSSDVQAFSQNIDKILPAIQNMNMGGLDIAAMAKRGK